MRLLLCMAGIVGGNGLASRIVRDVDIIVMPCAQKNDDLIIGEH